MPLGIQSFTCEIWDFSTNFPTLKWTFNHGSILNLLQGKASRSGIHWIRFDCFRYVGWFTSVVGQHFACVCPCSSNVCSDGTVCES